MLKTKTLKFINSFEDYDEPIVTEIVIGAEQDPREIMAWYGAYYSGDPYEVFINGRPVSTDLNGEPEVMTLDGDTL